MANTGIKHYTTRKQVMLDPETGLPDLSTPTGVTEPNVNDANYVADIADYDSCPLPTYLVYLTDTASMTTCQGIPGSGVAHFASAPTVIVGTIIYYSSNGSDPIAGDNAYWWIVGQSGQQAQISQLGVVLDIHVCV